MFFFQKCFECVAFIPFAAKKKKKLISPHCSGATLQQCEFILSDRQNWLIIILLLYCADRWVKNTWGFFTRGENSLLFRRPALAPVWVTTAAITVDRQPWRSTIVSYTDWKPQTLAPWLNWQPKYLSSLVWPMASKVLFLWTWPLFICKDFSVKEESDLACHR